MAKKKTTKKKATKSAASTKAPTKSEVYRTVAEETGVARKDVVAVVESLNGLAIKSLKKFGTFGMPGTCKMVLKKKPATKARKGINPFTGEEQMFKAKPASKTVRIRPVKALKDAIA